MVNGQLEGGRDGGNDHENPDCGPKGDGCWFPFRQAFVVGKEHCGGKDQSGHEEDTLDSADYPEEAGPCLRFSALNEEAAYEVAEGKGQAALEDKEKN